MAAAVTYTNFGGMLVHENRGGVETEYMNDTLGSLVECRDTSGTKTYEATYWPYGEIRTSSGTNPSPWAFVGLLGYYRESASRTYVRARYYRQEIARWMTVDPLWPHEQAFGYTAQRPTDFTDPTGTYKVSYQNCSKEQQDAINKGLDVLCGLNSPSGGAFLECIDAVPCRIDLGATTRNCFQKICNGDRVLNISCCSRFAKCNWWPFGQCRGSCAVTKIGHSIVICPDAWTSGCDHFGCILAHELIHYCGTPGEVVGGPLDCVFNLLGCGRSGAGGGKRRGPVKKQ